VKVLVVGGGGREHALCWALRRDREVDELVCAPGNVGIGETARSAQVEPGQPSAVRALAEREGADLVVVGPEGPLVAGVADELRAAGIRVFGPGADAARIEGSKAFAKEIMAEAGVPTAAHWSGTDPAEAKAALDGFEAPYVVKADGLAAGKGVRVCAERGEAEQTIDEALVTGAFGEAGRRVVIEAHLAGPELSVMGVCDGRRVVALPPARDFKRAGDGDTGPNTGGMGAYSPVPGVDAATVEQVRAHVLQPVVDVLARRGTPYVGLLYAGLVLTADGPRVLEFNCRFGDPEAQAVLPRLRSPLAKLLSSAARGRLGDAVADVDQRACVTVVLASEGYPGKSPKGRAVAGLEALVARQGVWVFHAGTTKKGGRLVTDGGRILSVSALGDDLATARSAAYSAIGRVSVEGAFYRHDIAANAAGA
jgi:phosphoribosylamine--glycine ligase